VRNHDELTLDKLSDGERQEVFRAFGPDERAQLYGRGLRLRLPTMLGGDDDRIRMTYSLMFSLPGTPVLFYGEEIGMGENLDLDGRMACRTPMQWTAERHRGFTTAEEPSRPLAPGDAQVAEQRRRPHSLLNWMERLIRRRRECPELGWGEISILDAGDPAVLAHRADWDGSTIVAVHSLADGEREVRVDVGDADAAVDLFAHEELEPRDGRVEVALGRYGHRWFRVRRPGQRVAP
jgi:maltose alpha-D-glucosyltransferase/alpha-amylase